MIFNEQTKSIPITKMMVWEAYQKVKRNKGSAGVDQQSLDDFDKARSKALYKIWNRLSSGSYFPPEVKRVAIRKQDGEIRPLGIPTVSDRIAQQVIKTILETRLEVEFSESSYGYRPNKSALSASMFRRNGYYFISEGGLKPPFSIFRWDVSGIIWKRDTAGLI